MGYTFAYDFQCNRKWGNIHTAQKLNYCTAPKHDVKVLMNKKSADNASSDIDTSIDMEVNNEGSENVGQVEGSATKSVKTSKKVEANANAKTKHKHRNKNKQLCHELYEVNRHYGRKIAPKTDAECRNFSSYSFSSSFVQQVTTTRRCYEDSTGRLKVVHERKIDGKKLQRQSGGV